MNLINRFSDMSQISHCLLLGKAARCSRHELTATMQHLSSTLEGGQCFQRLAASS